MADAGDVEQQKGMDPRYFDLTSDQAQTVAEAEKRGEEGLVEDRKRPNLTRAQKSALADRERALTKWGFDALYAELDTDPEKVRIAQQAESKMRIDAGTFLRWLRGLQGDREAPRANLIYAGFKRAAADGVRKILLRSDNNLVTAQKQIEHLNRLLNQGIDDALRDLSFVELSRLRREELSHDWTDDDLAVWYEGFALTRIPLATSDISVGEGLSALEEAGKIRGNQDGGLAEWLDYIKDARRLQAHSLADETQRNIDAAMKDRGYVYDTQEKTYTK
ncbi:hypothetical protein A2690_00385 [Candidatus Roizmanbacteria bacterium RIFCSPHIGHO2_01_FULL_39_12b]|uniref:Uncharacterized protein n=1 Tax=Candidatus Roizmanbacteria bacterium RIFCSPHIGHO2_01_FULL_39_12b TaxID=1802030 RepID=A0A1F7G8I1_9BACT|nr:MAG: hypothetical protein A2690_00385 [Candidatus Roizmanbacteria bacterium RIFCSPHIGHO2_01_FULL_39_12b]